MFNYYEKHEYNPKSECWKLFWIIYILLETSVLRVSKKEHEKRLSFQGNFTVLEKYY